MANEKIANDGFAEIKHKFMTAAQSWLESVTEPQKDSGLSEGGKEKESAGEKSKTSYYISKRDQASLKFLSEVFKIPQSEMIHWTTKLFFNIMQRSLERRRKSIPTLKLLLRQIESSIEAMKSVAPHLSNYLDFIYKEPISVFVALEERAAEAGVVSGLGVTGLTDEEDIFDQELDTVALSRIFGEGSIPAYEEDLIAMLGKDDSDSDLKIMRNWLQKLLSKEVQDE